MNKRYAVQQRKMIITDQAIYNMDLEGFGVNRRIPIPEVDAVLVSQMRDGFFVLRVPREYDYLYTSVQKTEIIKCIMDQYKKLTGKTLNIHVDNRIVYSPYHVSKNMGVRTIEFKEDLKVKMPTIIPTATGILVKVNNTEEVQKDAHLDKTIGLIDHPNSVYSGRKYRRKSSIGKQYLGDYLRLKQSPQIKQLFKKVNNIEIYI